MKKTRKFISFVLIGAFVFSLFSGKMMIPAKAADLEVVLYNKPIGNGINYTEKQLQSFSSSIKQRVNIVTADLNEKDVNIIFSKAKDTVKKADTLTQQIQRESFKGNDVVAGVNADMFNMSTGFSTGPQVRAGAIIAAHNTISEERIYPVFGIDKDKKAFIDNIYLTANLTAGSGESIAIDNINRNSARNTLVLNTYQLNEYKKLDFSTYASTGALTVVKGIPSKILLGKEYEGTVDTIGAGSAEAVLSEDYIVLASNGTKADWVKANLKPGDKIKIKMDYSKPNIVEALGAYSYLVKDGRTLTSQEMINAGASSALVTSRRSRTAVGITADNKVIAITSDGGTPSKGISDGITLVEMAQLMRNLGAVQAVSMDGGGSTQMNVKLNGEDDLKIINRPSDGAQRAITNGILFVSTSDRANKVGSIQVDKNIVIYKNNQYKFSISGTDTNYNSINLKNASVNWTVEPKLGKVDSNGVFTAGANLESGTITAEWGGVKGQANIYVVDDVDALNLNGGITQILQYGNTKQLTLNATAYGGQPVILNNSSAKWSITGNIGTIDENGLLKITTKKGSGEVSAQLGSKKVTVKVVVEDTNQLIDGFEHLDSSRYSINGYVGGVGSISAEQAKSGKYSYKVTYDYDKTWTRVYNGTINLKHSLTDKSGNDITETFMTSLMPKKLGMWVYGDGKAPWLRAVITDGEGNNRTLDLASRIDWTGWKYIDEVIPSDVPLPISLNYIYMVETNKTLHYKGTVYFDDIRFTYSDNEDLKGPEISGFQPSTTIYKKDVQISLILKDSQAGINPSTIKTKLDGKAITSVFDGKSGKLTYNAKGLAEGSHSFEVEAADMAGNRINPIYKNTFSVNLKADTEKPVITRLMPLQHMVVETATPRISVNIKDSQAGVDTQSISIYLDGKKLSHYYDEASGWAYAMVDGPLTAGSHSARVVAKDRAGNQGVEKTTSFIIQPLTGPKNPDSFTVSVTSDTHATGFGYDIFSAINKDESELVIQNGDIIDEDDESQWTAATRQLMLINNKALMLTPGNHEVVNGNLDAYMNAFGVSQYAYSYEYGNSLFITLNSAFSHSISAADPTQFDYLQKLLTKNTKQNVFLYTHVPTRDSFGTGHEMLKSDADKLEKILGDYKSANPSKNINVMFGNLHVSQSWEVSGVNYIITGNGCLKRYVKAENGGFLGYTKFAINGSKVEHVFIPLVERIAVMDPSLRAGEMKIIKGANKTINLYGDFMAQNANYIINLSKFKNMGIKWQSDNSSAVTISADGVMTTNGLGSSNIKATLGDETYSFKVTVIDSKEIKPVSIVVNSGTFNSSPGVKTTLKATAYDMYGNSFNLDNSLVKYQVDKSIGTISGGIFTAVTDISSDQSGYITATYLDCTNKVPVKVTKEKSYVTITATTLNVRETASATGKIVGTLKNGDKVEVVGELNDWLKINYNGKFYFISKQYTKAD
ncbi:MAG: hypothetical protein K0R09_929 [Clostridiales bacterium]|jgi:exopolysaccharide biosynthesis protein|nr:hypothetical protein [Clostridiales bacterium]